MKTSDTLDYIAKQMEENPSIIGSTGLDFRKDAEGNGVLSHTAFDPTHTYCVLGINTALSDGPARGNVNRAIREASPDINLIAQVENHGWTGVELAPIYRAAAERERKAGR